MLVIDPAMSETMLKRMTPFIDLLQTSGLTAVCLVSPNIRLGLRRLVESAHPGVSVISYNELLPDVQLISRGVVRMQDGH